MLSESALNRDHYFKEPYQLIKIIINIIMKFIVINITRRGFYSCTSLSEAQSYACYRQKAVITCLLTKLVSYFIHHHIFKISKIG